MALLHNEGQEKAGASQDSLGGKHDQFSGDTRSILCAGMFINHFTQLILTSRDRPKSAPYPRLKNSKKTPKCQVFSFTVLENRKFFEKKMDRLAR